MGNPRSVLEPRFLIAQLPVSLHPAALARLRARAPSAELAPHEDALWLRIPWESEQARQALHLLPFIQLYALHHDEQRLVPLGNTLPTTRLPHPLVWHPLADCLKLRLPIAALGGIPPEQRIGLTLVPAPSSPREPNLLLSTLDQLSRYAGRSAAARLHPLRFAASGKGDVLVLGEPLPAIPGEFFELDEGLALPLGYRFHPRLHPGELRDLLELSSREIALFSRDGSFERLRKDDFLPLTRSAIRLTQDRLANHPPATTETDASPV